jgi:hypothetical protein
MATRLSRHLRERMVLRAIPETLPEAVYREADSHFLDTQTGLLVAVKRLPFQGRERDMALSYTKKGDDILLVTIHPLQEGQRERRIQSGRWTPYEPKG